MVAFDAALNIGEFTAGGGSPKTALFTPSGTPRGFVCFIQNEGTNTDAMTSVAYGAANVPRVGGGFGTAVDAAIELGILYAYFLGSGIPTGAQTISIVHNTGIFGTKHAWAMTVTGTGDIEIVDVNKIEGDTSNPRIALNSGSRTALRVMGLYCGQDAIANITNITGVTRHTANKYSGSSSCYAYGYQTTPGSGSFSMGQDYSTDDTAMIAMALSEIILPTNQQIIGQAIV